MTDRILLQVLPVDEENEDLETTAAAVELTDQARRALAARDGVPGARYVMGHGFARIETDVYGLDGMPPRLCAFVCAKVTGAREA